MKQSIQFLVVIPKSRTSGIFYINGNLQDGHYKKYEDLYLFIAYMLHPPADFQVQDLIAHHEPFYVDIKENYVEHLTFDVVAELEELKKSIKKNVLKNTIKHLKKKKKKEKEEYAPKFQEALDTITNSILLLVYYQKIVI